MLDEFMKQYAEELELEEPFEPAMPGEYHLFVNDDTAIIINEADSAINLSVIVADLPNKEHEALYQELLAANLFGTGTFNAVLGINENTHKITLTRFAETPLNYKTFSDILEDFINAYDYWSEEITSAKT